MTKKKSKPVLALAISVGCLALAAWQFSREDSPFQGTKSRDQVFTASMDPPLDSEIVTSSKDVEEQRGEWEDYKLGRLDRAWMNRKRGGIVDELTSIHSPFFEVPDRISDNPDGSPGPDSMFETVAVSQPQTQVFREVKLGATLVSDKGSWAVLNGNIVKVGEAFRISDAKESLRLLEVAKGAVAIETQKEIVWITSSTPTDQTSPSQMDEIDPPKDLEP